MAKQTETKEWTECDICKVEVIPGQYILKIEGYGDWDFCNSCVGSTIKVLDFLVTSVGIDILYYRVNND